MAKPQFEAEIYYDGSRADLLRTYAESMGWWVDVLGHPEHPAMATLTGKGDNEDDLLRDTEQHLAFFENEGASPVHVRIVRIIYDSNTGKDEIHCPDCGASPCDRWGDHGT